ncbi:alkaline phosphatase family protein [Nanoarchaeota archaeon]
MKKSDNPYDQLTDKRYESVRKRLGLKKGKKAKKKFIIIQIDSLSHEILEKFFAKGSCKFLHSLIKKQGYNFQKWNCGVPSGTPHVQAGIMYGDNSMIPAFRFVDKKNRKQISFGNPTHVRYMEEKHFSKKKGILEGGASYANHWSGGAAHSIVTMSTMTKKKRLKRIKEWELWLFLLLYPRSVLRVLYYSTTELLIELGELITYPFIKLFRPKRAIFGFWIPFKRILMNAIGTELVILGVITDIKRDLPKIYVNFINYDDVAHLRGPNSAAAYFMLRATDRRIRRICRKAKDDYDIYVISDHGMVDAMTFKSLNRMTLAQFIEKCARVESFQLSSAFEGRLTMIGMMMRKMMDFLKYVSSPLRWIGNSFARGVIKMLKPRKYRFIWDRNERIYVLDSCCMAGVYFSVSKERMDKREIDRKYPKLIDKLIKNRGIGIIMVKKKDDILLIGKGGTITIKPKGIKREGRNFLKQYGNEDILLRQLRDYSKLKNVGDLVLFGNYVDGLMVSFTDHVGAHGGIGGNMTAPFFISKEKHDLSKVTNARELHKIFRDY